MSLLSAWSLSRQTNSDDPSPSCWTFSMQMAVRPKANPGGAGREVSARRSRTFASKDFFEVPRNVWRQPTSVSPLRLAMCSTSSKRRELSWRSSFKISQTRLRRSAWSWSYGPSMVIDILHDLDTHFRTAEAGSQRPRGKLSRSRIRRVLRQASHQTYPGRLWSRLTRQTFIDWGSRKTHRRAQRNHDQGVRRPDRRGT